MSPILTCAGLSVGYGSKTVLKGVELHLNPGEIVALLGPNGGGKTTLLKALDGLLPTQAGTIVVQGDELGSLSQREIARRIAFVPQDEAWHFDFTVEDVVAMGRLPVSNGFFETEEDRAAAIEAMRQADCYDLRFRPITEISGGERQRVLIARALAQETPILFLDEPTAHLDPQYQAAIASILRDMASGGKSLLIAVHDLPMAATLADRAILVYDGGATRGQPIGEVLNSYELDKAYSAEFERVVTPEGRLVVIARSQR